MFSVYNNIINYKRYFVGCVFIYIIRIYNAQNGNIIVDEGTLYNKLKIQYIIWIRCEFYEVEERNETSANTQTHIYSIYNNKGLAIVMEMCGLVGPKCQDSERIFALSAIL